MFLSLVRPDRISSPITRMAAVMTAGPDVTLISDLPRTDLHPAPPQNPLPRPREPLKRTGRLQTVNIASIDCRGRASAGVDIADGRAENFRALLLWHPGAGRARDG